MCTTFPNYFNPSQTSDCNHLIIQALKTTGEQFLTQCVDVFLLEDVVMRQLLSDKDNMSHCGHTLGHRLKGF